LKFEISDILFNAKHGLYRALVANMVTGVTQGFEFDEDAGAQTRVFSVVAGNTITLTASSASSSFNNVSVYVK
jgi:hypothetical protein